MMELYKYKSHYIYLLFITALAYLGTFFIVPIVPVQNFFSFFFWTPAILYINTLLLHWILAQQGLGKNAVFILCTLFLVNPLHIDAFEFPAVIQFYMAETALMAAWILYFKHRISYSLFFLITASFLNFKLAGFFPLILTSQRFSLKHKLIYVFNIFFILVYSLPEFVKESSFITDNLKTVIYSIENLIAPLNFTFLNNSILINDYYPKWFLILFVLSSIVLAVLGWMNKFAYGKLTFFTILGLFISLLIPVKYFLNSELHHYLFIPGPYTYITIIFFIVFAVLLKKYNSNVLIGVLGVVSALWILTNMSIQASSRDLVASWETALGKLPVDYNYVEEVQFNYVQTLVKKGYTKEAEVIVTELKKKFLKDRWFVLHISLASQRQDEDLVRKIYDELGELKIPLPEEELPENKINK